MFLSLNEVRRERARRSLIKFTEYTFPEYQTNWHHRQIAGYLDRFVSGEIRRLMVFCPPRHGKSELVSRRLPAYIFGKHPDAEVIATSYGDTLAKRMNRDVQRIIDSDTYREIFPNTTLFGRNVVTVADGTYLRNASMFEIVNHRGSYKCCGVGGGITGEGGNFIIIDDPIKNSEQARSKTYREKVWDWYISTLFTRLDNNLSGGLGDHLLVTLTHWHEDDLAGRILQSDYGKDWVIVSFPAISESESKNGDPRRPGEALWPAKKNIDELEKIRKLLGPWFNGLYQQNPKPLEGDVIPMDKFGRYETYPLFMAQKVQSWDTAQKADERHDYSVCTTWVIRGIEKYLIDVYREKLKYPDLKRACISQFEKHKPDVVLIEDKSSGTSLIQDVRYEIPVVPIIPCKDKETRMEIETAQIDAGCVLLPESAPWLSDYDSEMRGFPNSEFDDQADSTSQFLAWAKDRPGEPKYESVVERVLSGRGF